MKKIYIPLFLILISQEIFSQTWTSLGSNEQTHAPVIQTAAATFFTQVSNNGVPYISYIDDAGGGNNIGDFKVHARRYNSAINQWEFAGDAISPAFPGSDDFPIALDGNIPYVAYSEASTPVELQNKITVKRLNSNTGHWDVVGQQGLSAGPATSTIITASNGKIYVAYADGAFEGKLTVRMFDNANPSNNWQTVGQAGFSSGFVLGVNIVVDNGIPYVSYLDLTENALVVKQFKNNRWANVGTNSPSNGVAVFSRCLQFNSSHISFVAFVNADGTGVVRNLNAANAWVTTSGQPFATGIENPVSLTILQDVPFVAFGAKENSIIQLHVKRFNAATNTWPDAGTQPVTASTATIDNVSLVKAGNNKLMLAFRNFEAAIYAKSFDASGVLPVKLAAFTVSRQSDKNLLQWTTASELNNKMFEIEYSTDGSTFKKIGEIAAKTPAGIGHDYSFTHTQPVGGKNYYRLKQVDINGDHVYSKIVNINFSSALITIFPNPVIDILHAENLPTGRKEIIIRNTEGKILKQVNSDGGSIDINIATLPKGYYHISFTGESITETRQFVK